MIIRRYRTRAADQTWTAAGPDLLRRRDTARAAAVALLPLTAGRGGVFVGRAVRDDPEVPWREIGERRSQVDRWLGPRLEVLEVGARVQIGIRRWEAVEARAVVRCDAVKVDDLTNATAGAELTNALIEAQFPASLFAGCYACRRVSGSSSWSDHAWGDAIDRTAADGAPNDATTEWVARMAAAGELPAAQILGSRSGRVVEARRRLIGSWKLLPSSASTSHLWHVHVSIREHSGTPPCAS